MGLVLGVLLPWQLGSGNLYSLQRGVQLATLGVLVIGGLAQSRAFDPVWLLRLPQLISWSLSVAVLLMVAALALAPHPGVALLELGYLLLLAASGVLVALSVRRLPRQGWAVLGGLLALFMLVYSVLAIEHISLVWPFAIWHDFGPGFAHVRFYADVAVGGMPLTLLYALARRRPSLVAALLCILPLAVWWWLLWVSESRAALLGLFSGGVVALLLFGRNARWPLCILGFSAVLGLVGWWFLNPLGGGGDAVFTRDITTSSGRAVLWTDALGHALQHFPLGIGPMGFESRLPSAHAHNIFLNTAAEWGLPLALLLLGVLLYGCWVIYRRARSMSDAEKPIFACLVMAFVGVVVNAQFAGSHIIPLSALVLVLAIGLVFGYRPAGEVPLAELAGPAPVMVKCSVPLRATLVWAVLMLLYAYLLYAGLDLYWLSLDSTSTCFQEKQSATLYPRFWAQGHLSCMQQVAPDHWLFWRWH